MKHFVVLDDYKLNQKTKICKNDNTEKSERRAHSAFTKFLVAMGVPEEQTDYWNFTEPELDNYLAKFWFGARKDICDDDSQDTEEDPELKQWLYKANTLRNFRYGLNRILRSKGHLYDITDKKTSSFIKSQQAFGDAIKEFKAEGKADIDSYPEIEDEGEIFLKLPLHLDLVPDICCQVYTRHPFAEHSHSVLIQFRSQKFWWHIKAWIFLKCIKIKSDFWEA